MAGKRDFFCKWIFASLLIAAATAAAAAGPGYKVVTTTSREAMAIGII